MKDQTENTDDLPELPDLPDLPPDEKGECPKCGCDGATISYKLFRVIHDMGSEDNTEVVAKAYTPMPHLTCSTCGTENEPLIAPEEFEERMAETLPQLHKQAERMAARMKQQAQAEEEKRKKSWAEFLKFKNQQRRRVLESVYSALFYAVFWTYMQMHIFHQKSRDVSDYILVALFTSIIFLLLRSVHLRLRAFYTVPSEESEKDKPADKKRRLWALLTWRNHGKQDQ